jgi:murein DD-endopeptidase MepM/ murein hydrolase activator NlpD
MIDPQERFSLLKDIRENSRRLDAQEVQQQVQNDPSLLEYLQAALTPTERARLFPQYFKNEVPVDTGSTATPSSGVSGAIGTAVDRIFQPGKTVYQGVKKVLPSMATQPGSSSSTPQKQQQQASKGTPKFDENAKFTEPDLKSREGRMMGAYNAFRKAGFSDAWARAMVAEVGRENDFRTDVMFGAHDDPHNKARNLGMISMQGSRYRNLKKHLSEKGLLTETGGIQQSQAGLDAMAEYMMHEIKTDKSYSATRKAMEESPSTNPEEAARVLGKNYIRWRYDDPRYAHHHTKRRSYYDKIGGLVESDSKKKDSTPDSPKLATASLGPDGQPTAEVKPVPNIPDDSFSLSTSGPYIEPIYSGTMLHEGHGRTSQFGYARGRLHAGVDLYTTNPETGKLTVGPEAKVFAPADGKITLVRKNRGRAGNYIEIQDKNGIKHRFLHTAGETLTNPKTGKPWKPGDSISKGQHFTYVTGSGTNFGRMAERLGSVNAAMEYFDKKGWGSTNKPHLHYETRGAGGKPLDPVKVFPLMKAETKGQQIGMLSRPEVQQALAETGKTVDADAAKAETQKLVESIKTGADALPDSHPMKIGRKKIPAGDLPPADTGEMIQKSADDRQAKIIERISIPPVKTPDIKPVSSQTEPVRRQEPSIKPSPQKIQEKIPTEQPVVAPTVGGPPERVSTAPENVLKTEANKMAQAAPRQVQSDIKPADKTLNSQMPQQVAAKASAPKSYVDAVKRSSGHGPDRGYWNPIGGPALVG